MSEIIPALGSSGRVTPTGQQISGSVARRSQREIDEIAAGFEVQAVREQGRAFLTSQALTNVSTLVHQAESLMQHTPAGGQYYDAILSSYAMGAARRIANL